MPKRHYRDYSEDDKAAALAAAEVLGSQRAAERQFGLPHGTIRQWASGKHAAPAVGEKLTTQARPALADLMESIAYQAAEQVQVRLPDANAQQAAVVMGVSVDKMRLLRELPTSIRGSAPDLDGMGKEALIAYLIGQLRGGPAPVIEVKACTPMLESGDAADSC